MLGLAFYESDMLAVGAAICTRIRSGCTFEVHP